MVEASSRRVVKRGALVALLSEQLNKLDESDTHKRQPSLSESPD